jgi:hypothetical protein
MGRSGSVAESTYGRGAWVAGLASASSDEDGRPVDWTVDLARPPSAPGVPSFHAFIQWHLPGGLAEYWRLEPVLAVATGVPVFGALPGTSSHFEVIS